MRRAVLFWCLLAGVALGGLFDGIALHRLLQWHHLLSRPAAAAAETQHLRWDALLDALMWLALVAALGGLVRHRPALLVMPARVQIGAALAGFGLWHVADAAVAHWALGLHRIRPSAPDPLFWDLLWLALFGIAPALAGLVLLRRQTTAPLAAADGTSPTARRLHVTRRDRKGPPHVPPRSGSLS